MDIKFLIKNYQTPPHAVELVKNTNILLLAGVSGAGKDAIKCRLTIGGKYGDIVSHTTRSPRINNKSAETTGVDYHFVDLDQAAKMLESKEFIEAKLVHGSIYGSSMEALRYAAKTGVAVTDIDVQGVDEYKNIAPSVKAVFILPPSYEAWEERLKSRYPSEEAYIKDWPKRRETATKEIKMALRSPYYYFVINDKLDDVVSEIKNYAEKSDYVYDDQPARVTAHNLLKKLNI